MQVQMIRSWFVSPSHEQVLALALAGQPCKRPRSHRLQSQAEVKGDHIRWEGRWKVQDGEGFDCDEWALGHHQP